MPRLGQNWEAFHEEQSQRISILKEETRNGWFPFYLKCLKIHVNLLLFKSDCRMVIGKSNQHSLSFSQDCRRSLVNQACNMNKITWRTRSLCCNMARTSQNMDKANDKAKWIIYYCSHRHRRLKALHAYCTQTGFFSSKIVCISIWYKCQC